MNHLQGGGRRVASRALVQVIDCAHGFEGGHGLFQRRSDGLWAYRQDEISYYYALAEYRLGLLGAEADTRESRARWVEDRFCEVIELCADAVLKAAQNERVTPATRRAFERAKARCYTGQGCAKRWAAEQDAIWNYRDVAAHADAALGGKRNEKSPEIAVSQKEIRDHTQENFCEALRARPEVVLQVVGKEGLSPVARGPFEKAKRKCYRKDSWRSETTERPGFVTMRDVQDVSPDLEL